MQKSIFFCLILLAIISVSVIAAQETPNELLSEYKLLYTDLENLYTFGYKSYFSPELTRAIPIINAAQGSLQQTDVYSDFAIMGDGFFKIKLDNNIIGYTRNGSFRINSDGELVTRDGFSLFEPIIFPDPFLPETVKINKERYIFISFLKNGEISELKVGKLNLYIPPIELLEHYKDGIYILKENTDKEIIIDDGEIPGEFNFHRRIVHKFLELSNYSLSAVLLRMYYILLKPDNTLISNIEYKKELLKMIIDKLIKTEKYTMEEHNHIKGLMGTIFVPFLRYDY